MDRKLPLHAPDRPRLEIDAIRSVAAHRAGPNEPPVEKGADPAGTAHRADRRRRSTNVTPHPERNDPGEEHVVRVRTRKENDSFQGRPKGWAIPWCGGPLQGGGAAAAAGPVARTGIDLAPGVRVVGSPPTGGGEPRRPARGPATLPRWEGGAPAPAVAFRRRDAGAIAPCQAIVTGRAIGRRCGRPAVTGYDHRHTRRDLRRLRRQRPLGVRRLLGCPSTTDAGLRYRFSRHPYPNLLSLGLGPHV